MVGWHRPLNGHEFEQALGDGEGQGSLMCCSPWGCKDSDKTENLNKSSKSIQIKIRKKEKGMCGQLQEKPGTNFTSQWSHTGTSLILPAMIQDSACKFLPARKSHPSLNVQGFNEGHSCTYAVYVTDLATKSVAGQNLGFLCPMKLNKKYGDKVCSK